MHQGCLLAHHRPTLPALGLKNDQLLILVGMFSRYLPSILAICVDLTMLNKELAPVFGRFKGLSMGG